MNQSFTIFYLVLLCSFSNIIAQCDAIAGQPIAPIDCIVNDGSNIETMIVTEWSEDWSGVDILNLVVTAPADEDGNEIIIGVSLDGTFDFSNGDDEAFPPGTYAFTSFVYAFDDMYNITTNAGIIALLNTSSGQICLEGEGTETLGDILECVDNSSITDTVAVTLPFIQEAVFDSIFVLLNLTVCYEIGGSYTVDVVDNQDDCTTGISTVQHPSIQIYVTSNGIEILNPEHLYGNYSILDVNGKQIHGQKFDDISNHIPIQNTGLYFVQYQIKDKLYTNRLFVSKF